MFTYLYDMSYTFVCHVITTGSRVVLQAAVDNAVCNKVVFDGEHQSDDQVKQLMTILEERKTQAVGDVTMTTGDYHRNTSSRLQVCCNN